MFVLDIRVKHCKRDTAGCCHSMRNQATQIVCSGCGGGGGINVPQVTFSPESGGMINTMRERPDRKKQGRTRFHR